MSVQDARRRDRRDHFLAWLVTGPIGRLVAFVADLVVALTRGVINKVVRR